MKWILLFITAFLLTSCGWKFDRKLWKVKDVHYYCRDKMVKDVMNNHLYVGMTYGAVVEMLGTGDSKYEAEKSRDSVICGKIYKKIIKLYSDNILAFENYSEKYRVWQTPVLIVKDGATIYLEENEDRGVYYFGDFVPSNSRKFIYMSIYYTTLEFPGSTKEILKFSNGTIIDCQTGKELLSLFGTDVAGEWNNDDEWVSGDQILFSPLGIQK